MAIQLRDYQDKAVGDCFEYASDQPSGRLLLVCPPGGGKTIITGAFLLHAVVDGGMTALVAAHRREIVEQHYKHLVHEAGVHEELVGVIMSMDRRVRPNAPIQIASVDTLRGRDKPPADVVVTDEAHRDAADSRRALRTLYSDAFRLGVTASPCRMDGRGLGEDYDKMIVAAQYGQLIDGGWIVAPRVFTVPTTFQPDLTGVRVVRGDYESRALSRAMLARGLVGNIVDHWKARAAGMSTVIFAVSIEHSHQIVKAFQRAGIRVRHLDQRTPRQERQQYLEEFERGDVQILSCVNILSEGWDSPRCKCVVMARPTRSLNLHLQQSGRCMRPWEGLTPLILDHAGNALRPALNLPYLDREWKLTPDRMVTAEDQGLPPAKCCEVCQAVIHAGCTTCTECGADLPRADVPKEHAGQLVEYVPTQAERDRDRTRIHQFAARKGLPEEWADRVFRAKYDRFNGRVSVSE